MQIDRREFLEICARILGSRSGFLQGVSRLGQAEGEQDCFLIETVVL